MDRKTRKLITTYGGLHPRLCADRLYIQRSNGRRGLISLEDCVEEEKCRIGKHSAQIKEALVKIAIAELNLKKTMLM